MTSKKTLFTPIRVGSTVIKNRLAVPAMGTNLAKHNGEASDELIEYYTERARGGFGLIIQECTAISRNGKSLLNECGMWDDSVIPSYRRLTDSIHEAGGKIFCQLRHTGRETNKRYTEGLEVVAPSPIPCPACQEMPHELTTEEVLQNITRTQPNQRPLIYYPVHKKEDYFTMYPVVKAKGFFEQDDELEADGVRNLIIEKLGCTAEQAEDVIKQCLPLEPLEEVYSSFLKNIADSEKEDAPTRRNSGEEFYDEKSLRDVEDAVFREEMDHILDGLKPREQQVIRERYGFSDNREKTLEEVGSMLGVTRERVRQIESKALKKLRTMLKAKKFVM